MGKSRLKKIKEQTTYPKEKCAQYVKKILMANKHEKKTNFMLNKKNANENN